MITGGPRALGTLVKSAHNTPLETICRPAHSRHFLANREKNLHCAHLKQGSQHVIVLTMREYIRMWWLVRRLAEDGIDYEILMGSEYGYAINIDRFINLSSTGDERAAKRDRKALQRAQQLGYIEIVDSKTSMGIVLHALPEGHFFAAPTVGLEGFLRTFQWVNYVIYVTPSILYVSIRLLIHWIWDI